VYNAAGLSVEDVDAARRVAETILREAGIEASMRLCRMPLPPDQHVDPCEEVLTQAEALVRIINAPAPSVALDPDAFGSSYVVKSTDQGWLATVYADRVLAASARVGVDRRALIGRVLAHEVGHLLLGPKHTGSGLMMGQWPDLELRRSADASWRFTPDDAMSMQERLLDR
jgi:hypothetical protein